MIADRGCAERGCVCYDSRVDTDGVEMVRKKEWRGLSDLEIKRIIGWWSDDPIKGYTRKLFDQIEAALEEKNT